MKINSPKFLSAIKSKIDLQITSADIKRKKWTKFLYEQYKNKEINLPLKSFNIHPRESIEKLQDNIEKLLSSDGNEVILNQSRHWASAITWVLMSGAVFGLGWISVAKTDEVVIAIGKLEPKGGVIDVQMPIEGIAREILIKEGQQVRKGQVLIRLDTEATKAKNEALTTTLDLNNTIKDKLA